MLDALADGALLTQQELEQQQPGGVADGAEELGHDPASGVLGGNQWAAGGQAKPFDLTGGGQCGHVDGSASMV